tara:strand:- start:1146 stop:1553 length:408 start_codon:yes stop_codon:yes gene_type:complete
MLQALLPVAGKILDKVLPDKKAREEAQLALLKAEQEGELKAVEQQLSAILAEAKSNDPFTSRARPTFLYVVYICILAGIPMGVLYSMNPDLATNISTGFSQWLKSIPEEMWWLFSAGYLGYTGARSYDKNKIMKS